MIARVWNVPACGAVNVTRFRLRRSFLDGYGVHQIGGNHPGVLDPADDLAALNENIVGTVELVAEFTRACAKSG